MGAGEGGITGTRFAAYPGGKCAGGSESSEEDMVVREQEVLGSVEFGRSLYAAILTAIRVRTFVFSA